MKRTNTNTVVSRSFLLWLLFVGASYCHAAYILSVPPKDEECMFVSAPKNAGTFFGNYDFLDDSSKTMDAVSVVIMDTSNHRILHRSRRGSNEGNFKVEVSSGQKLQLCLQNGIWTAGKRKTPQNRPHDGRARTVGLTFSFEEKNPAVELLNQNGRLVTATRGLIRELSSLKDHYSYMRAREAMHRETVEGTFSRLMSWTLLEGAAVISVAVGQIVYFRRFLEERRYI